MYCIKSFAKSLLYDKLGSHATEYITAFKSLRIDWTISITFKCSFIKSELSLPSLTNSFPILNVSISPSGKPSTTFVSNPWHGASVMTIIIFIAIV